ncbi:MAG: hypothetical protein LQ340_004328 [Diploschistes diacapsis]|nr:MAG: hypothetical protein LQ340_004328 [Diploschistes diacapsis]
MDVSSALPPWASAADISMMQGPSVLLPPRQGLVNTASPSDTLSAVSRQMSYVQQELQELLDAQSTGLLLGLGKEPLEEPVLANQKPAWVSVRAPSWSPHGPTRLLSLPASPSALRRRGQDVPAMSLRKTRSSIHRALLQLSDLKASESSALAVQHESLITFLSLLENLASKKEGIENSIRNIEFDYSGRALGPGRDTQPSNSTSPIGLRDEEDRLSAEIHSFETRIYEMKARLAYVRRLRQAQDNKLAARVSSWKGALVEVDKSIQREVLQGRGLEGVYPSLRSTGRRKKDGQGVWALPHERRTTELVKEEVHGKAEEIAERRDGAEKEGRACAAGAKAWESILKKVEAVERKMSHEMQMSSLSKTAEGEGLVEDASSEEDGHMKGVLSLMVLTIKDLGQELASAQRKGWNLLICAIGAELEALKEGRDMLLDAVQVARPPLYGSQDPGGSMGTTGSRFSDHTHNPAPTSKMPGHSQPNGGQDGVDSYALIDHAAPGRLNTAENEPAVEMKSFDGHGRSFHDGEDDDEPGPEFLVEHVDDP